LASRKTSPKQIARLGIQRLKEMSDPVRAEGAQRYFKETFQCYGLTAVRIRDLAKETYQTVKPEWGIEDAIELCDVLLPNPYHEAKALGILVLERYKKEFPKSLFQRIKTWLASNYLDSWAAVDVLCPDCVGSLLEKYPDLVERIKTWAGSPNRWVRRAGLVSFIKLARKKEYLDPIYQISCAYFADRDDLIQKANGWLLREAGKLDAERLERFLLRHGPAIPRTTLRYASERFEEKKRKGILLATRKNVT
jgi:3-methyladenine DNA glycosylase AlkD